MNKLIQFFIIFLQFLSCYSIKSFYLLPGAQPQSYATDEEIEVYAHKLTSSSTHIPLEYLSLPFCSSNSKNSKKKLGFLEEETIRENSYNIITKKNSYCEVACFKRLSKNDINSLKNSIQDDYRVHWVIDGLPVGTLKTLKIPFIQNPKSKNNPEQTQEIFERGFPVGFTSGHGKDLKYNFYNHLRIIIEYHDDKNFEDFGDFDEEITTKIVGFRVEPFSIKHTWSNKNNEGSNKKFYDDSKINSCIPLTKTNNDAITPFTIDKNALESDLIFTYDVVWQKSDVEWTHRWDIYLTAYHSNDSIHLFSLITSITLILALSFFIAVILIRILKKDINQYNNNYNIIEEAKEESGWKLVHGDVFRPPTQYPMLFCVFVGSGTQLFLLILLLLVLSFFDFINPVNNDNNFTSFFIFLYFLMSSVSGYVSSYLYKNFKGLNYKKNIIITSLFYPSVIFGVLIFINFLLYLNNSSGFIPFKFLFFLLFIILFVNLPLNFIGSYYGYKKESIQYPVKISFIPRIIPYNLSSTNSSNFLYYKYFNLNRILLFLSAGILPFFVILYELNNIISLLWVHHYYYILSFFLLLFIILLVICGEIAIILCYIQLVFEDYNWWWRSFFNSASFSFYFLFYVLVYNIFFYSNQAGGPDTSFFHVIFNMSYFFILFLTLFLITGTIGFYSCLLFNWKIYSSIKVD